MTPGIYWDKHHEMCFPPKNLLSIHEKYEILYVIQYHLSMKTNKQYRIDLLQIAGLLETTAICSYKQ